MGSRQLSLDFVDIPIVYMQCSIANAPSYIPTIGSKLYMIYSISLNATDCLSVTVCDEPLY